jgi:hypothetical protein
MQGERYTICVISKAGAHQYLIAGELEGHKDPFDAFEHLIVRLGTMPNIGNTSRGKKQKPNMTDKNRFSLKERPDPAEWRD